MLALSHSGEWDLQGSDRRGHPGRHRLAAWLAALLLFLALGSKEVALATLFLYMTIELLFRPRGKAPRTRFWIERITALAPSALAVSLYLVLRTRALEALVAMQRPSAFDNPLVLLEGVHRAGTALGLVARAVRLLLYPLGLSADYSGQAIRPAEGLATPAALAGTLLLLGCLALALRPLLRRGSTAAVRRWSFAALLFLLPYLVVGNLFFNVGTIFAERLLYFPSAGFCLMAGLLLGAIASGSARMTLRDPSTGAPARGGLRWTSSRLAVFALSTLLAGFMVLTWARTREWRDDETLFRASARARPGSPRAHYIVGKMLADRGEPREALHWFDRAIELHPTYVAAWNERGAVYGRLGDWRRAEEDFRQAVRVQPAFADAHLNLAITLGRRGSAGEAERALRRALLWDPLLSTAWAELGNLYLRARQYEHAIRAYERGIALGRGDLAERIREAERRASAP
jgi:tetratricopeptide (TPR) repeat protein